VAKVVIISNDGQQSATLYNPSLLTSFLCLLTNKHLPHAGGELGLKTFHAQVEKYNNKTAKQRKKRAKTDNKTR